MTTLHPALPHGPINEVLPDVFFVTGTRKGEFLGANWHFSRNMTILRHGNELAIINSVRLTEEGLAQLESLGSVRHLLRIGALHGIDDPFYLQRYSPHYWSLVGGPDEGLPDPEHALGDGTAGPFPGTTFFGFEHSRMPEFILRLEGNDGVLIACDALQNWREPDEFFSEDSIAMMTQMGFFVPANVGPVWRQLNEPGPEDFLRLRELPFRHVLCGHGQPLLNTAREEYSQTFAALFNI